MYVSLVFVVLIDLKFLPGKETFATESGRGFVTPPRQTPQSDKGIFEIFKYYFITFLSLKFWRKNDESLMVVVEKQYWFFFPTSYQVAKLTSWAIIFMQGSSEW